MQKMNADDIALNAFKPGDLVRWIGEWQYARNPFLIEQRAENVKTIKAQVDGLREFVRRAGGARRQVTRG